MKINLIKNRLRINYLQRFFFLFVTFFFIQVQISQAQQVSLSNTRLTLRTAFTEIERQTDMSVDYNREIIDVNKTVSIPQQNGSLADIMSALLRDTGCMYTVRENHIIITKAPVVAQPVKQNITGTIVDAQGEPVIGANVVEKGTTNGTVTDIDGRFTVNVNNDAVLQISYIGYLAQEVPTAGKNSVSIILQEDAKSLEELVVVGYGTMRKKDLTGSVIQIRPDNIAIENPKTVQDILRGTPGLQVGYNASAKGGGNMQIRGQRSVYTDGGHNSPLLILDGMQFYGELSEINPDDIAQIDVLKDASASAIYGAKAASGVIIITTKKGQMGKPVINVSTNIGMTQQSDYRKRFSPGAYLQHRQDWFTLRTYGVNPETGAYEAYQARNTDGNLAYPTGYFDRIGNVGRYDVSEDMWRGYTVNEPDESDLSIWARRLEFQGNALNNLLAGKTVDWADKTYRTGFNQDYNASISGAGENVNYYFSLGYLKNQGAAKSDEYEAIRANMKVDANITKWFQVSANVNFQDRSDGEIGIDLDYQLRNSPYADYADENGNPVQYPLDGSYSQRGYNYDFQKQYLELEKGYTTLNTILNAKITLPYNITYSFNASPRYQFFYDRYFMSADLPGSNPASRGVNREQTKRFDWSLNNTISWDYTFNQKHHVILTLVQEAEERESWLDRIEARNIQPSDALGFHNTKNGTKENSSFWSTDAHQTADALLARLFYSYDDRYMITGSIRRDGYSGFGTSNPYATFPSVGTAWTFTNEKFFKWTDIMNNGKLRVSYGKNGNRSLSDPYQALANLYEGAGKMQGYITATGDLDLYRYLMANRMANPNLQWEKTASWNFGLDFGFLNDRISGTLEYYNMKTTDMIMKQSLPGFTGFTNITTNLGQVDNHGIEISLNTLNIDTRNFKWTTGFGFSYNKNEIKHLYYEYEDVIDANGNVIGRKEMDDLTEGWFIGRPISQIWNYRVTGIWQKDEVEEAAKYGQLPGDPKVENSYTADDIVNADGSVTPVYNDKDRQFLGQTSPPIHWSIRNEFTLWKDLTVSFNIYSYMGHKSLANYYLNFDDDGGRMTYALQNVTAKEYWTVDNPTNKYGRINAQGPSKIGGPGSPGKIYDRSFIRLENIAVGYTLPVKWTSKFELERVKIYGSIRNVATWAKDWEYGDPEVDPAFDSGNGKYGGLATRVYTLGVNFTF
jgi:TonB-linked SusC/RagA family outer membrane protein